MSGFVTGRERRLWVWAGIVVVAIYSTLGLARLIADELRNRELFDAAFVMGFVLVWLAIGAVALRVRPGGAEIGVAVGVAAVYLMVFARMGIPEERTHLFEYSVLGLLVYEALVERKTHGGHAPFPAVIAFAAASVAGVIDELIQAVLPSRVFDVRDMGFNVLAVTMAIAASALLRQVRRRAQSG